MPCSSGTFHIFLQNFRYIQVPWPEVTFFLRILHGLCFALLEELMLWTIFVMLLILWLLGLVSSYTLGGYIHLLLVIALVVLVVNLITGRRPAL